MHSCGVNKHTLFRYQFKCELYQLVVDWCTLNRRFRSKQAFMGVKSTFSYAGWFCHAKFLRLKR